jgi:signal transduction histidine kinase
VLYRGAQEALTNVARHAPGAPATVILRYQNDCVVLSVENLAAAPGPGDDELPAVGGLSGMGGGHGLAGLRDRLARAGGTLHAGRDSDGWRVDLEVPT